MRNLETGSLDPNKFGWDNRVTGGALLGSSISVTITEGTTIDASTFSAYWLGWVKGMQYTGLAREGAKLPGQGDDLTNCFASTYSFLSTLDTAGYNWNTLSSVPGSFKGFDVAFLDPMNLLADSAVNYEMCDGSLYID